MRCDAAPRVPARLLGKACIVGHRPPIPAAEAKPVCRAHQRRVPPTHPPRLPKGDVMRCDAIPAPRQGVSSGVGCRYFLPKRNQCAGHTRRRCPKVCHPLAAGRQSVPSFKTARRAVAVRLRWRTAAHRGAPSKAAGRQGVSDDAACHAAAEIAQACRRVSDASIGRQYNNII